MPERWQGDVHDLAGSGVRVPQEGGERCLVPAPSCRHVRSPPPLGAEKLVIDVAGAVHAVGDVVQRRRWSLSVGIVQDEEWRWRRSRRSTACRRRHQ
uniref:Uncharacterized protein n=1 Tax=Oryza punctata TaxID=4537 RepID=A0A0E0L7G6_ORYPU